MQDSTIAPIQIVSVKVAGKAETVILWRRQHELAGSEGVEADGREGDLTIARTIVVLDDNVGADKGDPREIGVTTNGSNLERNDFWSPLGARVGDNVTLEECTDAGWQLTVFFVVTVATVFHTVADEQISDALRIAGAALEFSFGASITFEANDTFFQRVSLPDSYRIDAGVDLSDQCAESCRQSVDALVEFLEVIRVINISCGSGHHQRDRHGGGNQ